MKRWRLIASITGIVLTGSCEKSDFEALGYEALSSHVSNNRVGMSQDHWVEMRNMIGEWERTGLIFGYSDDYGECMKAISGLREVNFNREYRCVPAN